MAATHALESSLVGRFQQALDACDQAIGRTETPGGPRAALAAPLCAIARPQPQFVPGPVPAVQPFQPTLTPALQSTLADGAATSTSWLKPFLTFLGILGLAVASYFIRLHVINPMLYGARPPRLAREEEDEEEEVVQRLPPPASKRPPIVARQTKAAPPASNGGVLKFANLKRPPRIPSFAAPRVRFGSEPSAPVAKPALQPVPEEENSPTFFEEEGSAEEEADPNFTPL